MMVKGIGILLTVLLYAFIGLQKTDGSQIRQVLGEVVAIETAEKPQTIAVKTTSAAGKRLIVGCRLESGTKIRIDRRPATLDRLHVGDRVKLIYQRVEDSLVVQMIEKR